MIPAAAMLFATGEAVVKDRHANLGRPFVRDPGSTARGPRVDVSAAEQDTVAEVAAIRDVPAVVRVCGWPKRKEGNRGNEDGERQPTRTETAAAQGEQASGVTR